MKALTAWLVLAMANWIPLPGYPIHDEPLSDYAARRASIAEDILTVAQDPAEEPLFDGPTGREETALFMASIASFESAYDLFVDNGKRRGAAGEVCIMQVSVDAAVTKRGMVTAEGWTRDELISDRKKCLRAALHKLQASKKICGDANHVFNQSKRALKGADLYTLYTGGRCSEGSQYAARRYDRARRWLGKNPVPKPETQVAKK